LRSRHAQVAELAVLGGGRLAQYERQAPPVEARPHELVEAGFPDGHLAPRQPVDPLGDDVGARDLMAQVGEAGRRRQPDVARAEDRNPTHWETSSFTSRTSGAWESARRGRPPRRRA